MGPLSHFDAPPFRKTASRALHCTIRLLSSLTQATARENHLDRQAGRQAPAATQSRLLGQTDRLTQRDGQTDSLWRPTRDGQTRRAAGRQTDLRGRVRDVNDEEALDRVEALAPLGCERPQRLLQQAAAAAAVELEPGRDHPQHDVVHDLNDVAAMGSRRAVVPDA